MQSSAKNDRAAVLGEAGADGSLCAFPIIANELERVRSLIERELSDCSEPVRGLVAQISAGKGKMIRPGLVLLSGLACGGINEKHICAAAIVEMIHDATLLHDDVVDEGKSRRGLPTLNSLRGNESAVLLGDFLLSRVFRMCVGLGGRAAEMIASAAAQTCEGELRQIAQRGNLQLSESEYIEIIGEKTAVLFEAACKLGAVLAGADDTQQRMLADYGRNTGIAFQITDDLLDLIGDETKTGKKIGSDLDRNKLTLPLIHLTKTAKESDKETIQKLAVQPPGPDANNVLLEKLNACGSIEYAKNRAKEFIERAIGALAGLSNGKYKTALIKTAKFVVERTA